MLDNSKYMFKKRENVADIEEGRLLSPKFDNDGLIPVITTCLKTKEILIYPTGIIHSTGSTNPHNFEEIEKWF